MNYNKNRIILLFNKTEGEFKDLPFDIEKRSCLDFKISSGSDSNGIGQLREGLIERLTQIIQTNPEKPTFKTEILNKGKLNDLKVINKILLWFPLKEMDAFYKSAAFGDSIESNSSLASDVIATIYAGYVSAERKGIEVPITIL